MTGGRTCELDKFIHIPTTKFTTPPEYMKRMMKNITHRVHVLPSLRLHAHRQRRVTQDQWPTMHATYTKTNKNTTITAVNRAGRLEVSWCSRGRATNLRTK
jgi:hypothetical protein